MKIIDELIEKEKPNKGLEIFCEEFAKDRIEELSELLLCVNNADLTSAAKIVHKWKGFSAPYGFNYLEAMSKEIEVLAKQNNVDEIKVIAEKIEYYLNEKRRIISNGI